MKFYFFKRKSRKQVIMIIPIQREGAVSPSTSNYFTNPTTSKTSSSTYTSKKSVRITPKITEVEFLPRPSSQQNHVHQTTVPVSILSSSKSKSSDFNDLSALNMFESSNKRWIRDDMDDFVLPSLTSPSLLKDKFDSFSNHAMTSMSMPRPAFRQMQMDHHPIKIDTFVTESDKYVVSFSKKKLGDNFTKKYLSRNNTQCFSSFLSQLTLNVEKFKPDEIQVKVTDDTISVTGKHEEKQDEANFSCQEYSRKHTLPPGVKADDVKCALSLSGVLTISAPRKEFHALQQREITIPIKHSGLPAIRV